MVSNGYLCNDFWLFISSIFGLFSNCSCNFTGAMCADRYNWKIIFCLESLKSFSIKESYTIKSEVFYNIKLVKSYNFIV